MVRILEKYSRASGQMINLNKSRIVFSANTSDEQKEEMKRILQIEDAPNTGTYLGIPSFCGKTKRQAMSYVKEKVVKKLSMWKQHLLTQAVKKVETSFLNEESGDVGDDADG
ncbi:hypothetical protein COLO4_38124 [Corchorus olitorius]|uniref:Reverse transcriptase n=1 Tax=Corchorus olitorius TaxID=93759 RepID=A0A1R3FWW6_9ROSI|nr:hypothetical protein COLO4_38124 [Corchorus olitorius]